MTHIPTPDADTPPYQRRKSQEQRIQRQRKTWLAFIHSPEALRIFEVYGRRLFDQHLNQTRWVVGSAADIKPRGDGGVIALSVTALWQMTALLLGPCAASSQIVA
jgi:hypothetical protein